MKKIVSLLLVLTLMMSLAIPAFADDSAATAGNNSRGYSEILVTTVVPEPSYTMVLPAEVEIAYGDLDAEIAVPEVTDVVGFDTGDTIWMTAEHDDLWSEAGDWIDYDLQYLRMDGDELLGVGDASVAEATQIAYQHGAEVEVVLGYIASFSKWDWETAAPGAYEGRIYFNYWYVPAEEAAE